MGDDDGSGGRDRGRVASAISSAIAGLHRERYGRGATRTRTVMGSDYVIVFLDDDYTPVERTLINAGRFDAVKETRSAFQATIREKFSEAVERLSARWSASSQMFTSIPTSPSKRSSWIRPWRRCRSRRLVTEARLE
jgi:uncharacterized protein YbcI